MEWRLTSLQILVAALIWSASLFGSLALEVYVDALDWPWYVHATISVACLLLAGACMVVHNCRQARKRQQRTHHLLSLVMEGLWRK